MPAKEGRKNQSINQSIDQTKTNQSINQSIERPFNQRYINQSINQSDEMRIQKNHTEWAANFYFFIWIRRLAPLNPSVSSQNGGRAAHVAVIIARRVRKSGWSSCIFTSFCPPPSFFPHFLILFHCIVFRLKIFPREEGREIEEYNKNASSRFRSESRFDCPEPVSRSWRSASSDAGKIFISHLIKRTKREEGGKSYQNPLQSRERSTKGHFAHTRNGWTCEGKRSDGHRVLLARPRQAHPLHANSLSAASLLSPLSSKALLSFSTLNPPGQHTQKDLQVRFWDPWGEWARSGRTGYVGERRKRSNCRFAIRRKLCRFFFLHILGGSHQLSGKMCKNIKIARLGHNNIPKKIEKPRENFLEISKRLLENETFL